MHFDKPTYTVRKTRKKDIPKGVYTKDPATGERIRYQRDVPFFRRQVRTILERNEKADPIRILHHVANGGYAKPTMRVVDLESVHVVQTLQLDDAWYGLAWNPNGRSLYAAGAAATAGAAAVEATDAGERAAPSFASDPS